MSMLIVAVTLLMMVCLFVLGDCLRRDFKKNVKELQRIIDEDEHENK